MESGVKMSADRVVKEDEAGERESEIGTDKLEKLKGLEDARRTTTGRSAPGHWPVMCAGHAC